MKKVIFIILITLISTSKFYSQNEYSMKIETGYLVFIDNTVQVDPGPDWKGYYINSDGFDLNIINGFKYNHKIFYGLGLGYLNFDSNSGVSIFGDFEYIPFDKKLSPIVDFKIGYSHLFNQYENGTGTILTELNIGGNIKLSDKGRLYIKSGIMLTQQASLIPISFGYRF